MIVRQRKGIDVKTLGQLAMWIDQYARKIDRLPLVNVDKDMQDYSAEIAGLLRKMSAGYKGYGIRSGAREAQYHSGTSSGDYGYGSTIAMALTILSLGVTLMIFRSARRDVR